MIWWLLMLIYIMLIYIMLMYIMLIYIMLIYIYIMLIYIMLIYLINYRRPSVKRMMIHGQGCPTSIVDIYVYIYTVHCISTMCNHGYSSVIARATEALETNLWHQMPSMAVVYEATLGSGGGGGGGGWPCSFKCLCKSTQPSPLMPFQVVAFISWSAATKPYC